MKNQKSSNKHEAQKYMETYGINNIVSEMLNSLLHEKSQNPIVYMIKYLASYLTDEEKKEFKLDIPEPYPDVHPIVRYPKFDSNNESLLKKYLSKDIYQQLRKVKTKFGNTINSVTNLCNILQNNKIGCLLSDSDCINVYPFLNDIIQDIHNVKINDLCEKDFTFYPQNLRSLFDIKDLNKFGLLKTNFKKLVISFSRNMIECPFNNISNGTNRALATETIIDDVLHRKINDFDDKFKKIINTDNDYEDILNLINYNKDLLNAYEIDMVKRKGIIYINTDQSIIILINFLNHFQIFGVATNLDNILNIIKEVVQLNYNINVALAVESNPKLGFLTSEINLIGYGLNLNSELIVNKIDQDVINNLQFDDYEIKEDNSIKYIVSNKSCKLYEKNPNTFITKYISSLVSLNLLLNSEDSALNFDKLEFKEESNQSIKDLITAYNNSYDSIKYTISFEGYNINYYIKRLIENTNENIKNNLFNLFNNLYDYSLFSPLIKEYLKISQNFDADKIDHISKEETKLEDEEIDLELLNKYVKKVNIILYRNIENYPTSSNESTQTEIIESIIKNTLSQLHVEANDFGKYYSFINDKEKADELLNKISYTLNTTENMEHRGIIEFHSKDIYGIVNDIDHLKLIVNINNFDISLNTAFIELIKVNQVLYPMIKLMYDNNIGFLCSSPKYLGTGFDGLIELELSKISIDEINSILSPTKFKVYNYNENEGKLRVQIKNYISIGLGEVELMTELLLIINQIINKEI